MPNSFYGFPAAFNGIGANGMYGFPQGRLGSGVQSTAQNPSSIPGLQLWLTADSLILANGVSVDTWTDVSINARALTKGAFNAPTFVTNQLNGLPAVRFGGAQSLAFSGTPFLTGGTMTVILVAKLLKPATSQRIIHTGADNALSGRIIDMTTTGLMLFRDGSGGNITSTDYTTGTWRYATTVMDGSSSSVSIQGGTPTTGTISTSTADAASPFVLGANVTRSALFLNTDIAEVLAWNRALDSTERGQVQAYLADKYAF